jgi:FtsP/CotA-like multicopper oxidase with cupredoxin domain
VTLSDVLNPDFRPFKESDAVRTRRFVFARVGVVRDGVPFHWTINTLPFEPDRIDATPRTGDVEIWELVNPGGGWTHPIHIHLDEFLILDRNGGPPLPAEGGFKDMFLLRENETVRVIGRFDGIASPGPGRPIFERTFPFHCHNLEHEDHAMMSLFEPVARPGVMPTPAPLPGSP